MAPAQHLVLHDANLVGCDVSHHDLRTFENHRTIHDPRVGRRTAATPAQRFHLERLDAVGQLDHPLRPGEELGPEVGSDTEGVDIDIHLVHQPGELFDLCRRIELGLVADQVVHPLAAGGPAHDDVPEVEAVQHLKGGGGQTKT